MRAKGTQRPSASGRPHLDATGVLLAAGLLAAFAAAAVLVGPLLADEGLGSATGIAVLAGVGLVVLLGAAAVAAMLRDGRQRAARSREAAAWFEGLQECAAATGRQHAARDEPKEERSGERVLRMQVTSLERALEDQDERLAASLREERRKTLLTIAALRGTLEHESGEVVLNRIEATLARLGATPAFTRPALPAGRTGAPVVFFGPPQPLVPGAADAPPTESAGPAETTEPVAAVAGAPQDPDTPGTPATAVEEADPIAQGRPDTASDTASDTTPDTAPGATPVATGSRPTVRPVPAPVRPPAPDRGRRRFRRSSSRV